MDKIKENSKEILKGIGAGIMGGLVFIISAIVIILVSIILPSLFPAGVVLVAATLLKIEIGVELTKLILLFSLTYTILTKVFIYRQTKELRKVIKDIVDREKYLNSIGNNVKDMENLKRTIFDTTSKIGYKDEDK